MYTINKICIPCFKWATGKNKIFLDLTQGHPCPAVLYVFFPLMYYHSGSAYENKSGMASWVTFRCWTLYSCIFILSLCLILLEVYFYKIFNNSEQRGGVVVTFWDDSEHTVVQAFLRRSLFGFEWDLILLIFTFNVLEILMFDELDIFFKIPLVAFLFRSAL